MKKFIAAILAGIMLLLCSCTPAKNPETPTEPQKAPYTALEVAQELANVNSLAEASIVVTEIEPEQEYFIGFDNYTVTDIAEGAVFSPMIGVMPFVGYVFRVKEGVSVDQFKASLKEHAVLNWNICTTADTMICENYSDMVLFVMLFSEDMPDTEQELINAFNAKYGVK